VRSKNSARRVRTAASSGGSDPPQSEGDDEPPDAHRVARACVVCGASLEGRRPQTRTCKDACRQRAYNRRRKLRQSNGNHNGNGNGEKPLSPPEFRRLLANAVARERLERAGGHRRAERNERDLARAIDKLLEAA